jgi:hypothetical protein
MWLLGRSACGKIVECFCLQMKSIPAKLADTRDLIVTDSNFGDAQPLDAVSKGEILFKFLKKMKIHF